MSEETEKDVIKFIKDIVKRQVQSKLNYVLLEENLCYIREKLKILLME